MGGGTNANDILVYNILDDLLYWNEGGFAAPLPNTQIRIVNNPTTVADIIVGIDTGIQRGSIAPLKNSIGQSSGTGDFHAHVDFQLEPSPVGADETPLFGAYGIKMSLTSSSSTIEESDPFFIVFQFGLDEASFTEALDDFGKLLESQLLVGDFDQNGVLEPNDIDLLSDEVRRQSHLASFDLNTDRLVNEGDRILWVESLAKTYWGDADLNQRVEFADFLALSSTFGRSGGWRQGDFDGNGMVQFPDFLVLANNFGKVATSRALVAPEPSTFLGLSIFLFSKTLPSRRRRCDIRF